MAREHQKRGTMERPDYTGGTPERHAPHDAVGTTKQGVEIHGSYQQPWKEHDGIKADPTSQIDGDGKDVG